MADNDPMRQYRHPEQRLRDPRGELRGIPARPRPHAPGLDPSYQMGLAGGEMARRMVEAALAYLTERATSEIISSFTKTVFAGEGPSLPGKDADR